MTEPNSGDQLLLRVDQYATDMANAEQQCERGYAHLGWLLLEVAEMRYWRVRYNSFGDYLKGVARGSKKTPGQLRQYFLTVRDLSETLTCEELERIGITKAIKLRQAKDYAIVLPASLIAAALDPTVTARDLKKAVSTTLKMPEEPGDWMDLEMEFMVTPEQRALLEQAIDVAMRTEPLTKSTISKSAQMLDVITKFSQEYLGAHCGDGQ